MPKPPTYKEQFDKLTRAYINNEVKGCMSCSCFCGNLLNNTSDWSLARRLGMGTANIDHSAFECAQKSIIKESIGLYSVQEILDLEYTFMGVLGEGVYDMSGNYHDEDTMFRAFEKTLDRLKQIHISKGENVDETPVFEKRKLVNH